MRNQYVSIVKRFCNALDIENQTRVVVLLLFFNLFYFFVTISLPSSNLRMFGCFSKSLVPAPIPIFRIVNAGGRPVGAGLDSPSPTKHSARSNAAPVGVTSSPVTTPMGPGQVGMPTSNRRVAGAGTGKIPWSVQTLPSPMGIRLQVNDTAPR